MANVQVEVIDGALHKGDRVTACSSGDSYEILEVGSTTARTANWIVLCS